MLIVDKPQDTSKNIQKKELKKSKRMAAEIIRVMRDRTGIDRDMSCITGTKMEHAQRRFWENPKAKQCTPWRDSQLLWIHALLLSGFYNKQLTCRNDEKSVPHACIRNMLGGRRDSCVVPTLCPASGWSLRLPSPYGTG